MWLHPTDIQNARQLKTAIQEDKELELNHTSFSDYMLAQIAIAEWDFTPEDTLEMRLQAACRLQHYKEEYKIQDTLEEGRQLIEQAMLAAPGFVVDLFHNGRTNILLLDMSKLMVFTEAISNWEHKRTMVATTYYIFQALFSSFDYIEKGALVVMECGGVNWRAPNSWVHQGFEMVLKHTDNLYPAKWDRIRYINTGAEGQNIIKMAERIMKPETLNRTHVWPDCQGYPFPAPNPQEISKKLVQALWHRYENERTFSLSDF